MGGYQYGIRRLARIDCCDPAGPSFPATALSVQHTKYSAQKEQCIHTTSDKGTTLRYCQKSVNMRNCGTLQVGATSPPVMSHGLSPIFYRNSSNNNFVLIPKATVYDTFKVTCANKTVTPDVTTLVPTQMGFHLNMSIPNGEYYAITGKLARFNLF